MMDMNSDLIDVCMASGQNEQGLLPLFFSPPYAVLYPADYPTTRGNHDIKKPLACWDQPSEMKKIIMF